jgi:uncharacterized membrane protein YedE/YeeE
MANPNSPTTVRAVEAVLGGLILGTSSGIYMYVAGKVAGNSGAVKACVLSIADSPKNDASRTSNILFLVGLLTAGLVTSFATPWGFEPYAPIKDEWYSYVFGGLLVGSGTYLANGCTSGHGLSGLSKFSLRSVVATPIFMFFAALTAMIKSSFAVGPIAPFVASPVTRLHSVGWMLLVLLVLFVPVLVLKIKGPHYTKHVLLYVGLWCGLTFGVGLAVGGMVRPSAVTGALSMKRFDFTLWILFTTGLVTTFVHYRIAEWMGIKDARAQKQGPYDKKLIGGSILFGIGVRCFGVVSCFLFVGLATYSTTAVRHVWFTNAVPLSSLPSLLSVGFDRCVPGTLDSGGRCGFQYVGQHYDNGWPVADVVLCLSGYCGSTASEQNHVPCCQTCCQRECRNNGQRHFGQQCDCVGCPFRGRTRS